MKGVILMKKILPFFIISLMLVLASCYRDLIREEVFVVVEPPNLPAAAPKYEYPDEDYYYIEDYDKDYENYNYYDKDYDYYIEEAYEIFSIFIPDPRMIPQIIEPCIIPPPTPTPAPRPRPAHLNNIDALSDAAGGWHFVRQPGGPPRGRESAAVLRPFDAFFIGDTTVPRIFLTFDSGYERGYTNTILDTLQEFNIHAAFFLTESYIRRNPAIVQRKINEGHVIANHSVTHRDFTELSDAEIERELVETADRLYELTGHTMSPFFRPPAGRYSHRVLALIQSHGYYTVFWSFAHRDWVVADQPPVETTIERVVGSLHNGMVILLHTNSRSNTFALPYILEQALELGFEFASLYELLQN